MFSVPWHASSRDFLTKKSEEGWRAMNKRHIFSNMASCKGFVKNTQMKTDRACE